MIARSAHQTLAVNGDEGEALIVKSVVINVRRHPCATSVGPLPLSLSHSLFCLSPPLSLSFSHLLSSSLSHFVFIRFPRRLSLFS